MIEKWIYVLIGDNDTGKTTFQKKILKILFDFEYQKLPSHQNHTIENYPGITPHTSIYLMGRSIQEFSPEITVGQIFKKELKNADIGIFSSHINDNPECLDILREYIELGHKEYYNVAGIFFTNSPQTKNQIEATQLNWDRRLILDNPTTKVASKQASQIRNQALKFLAHLSNR